VVGGNATVKLFVGDSNSTDEFTELGEFNLTQHWTGDVLTLEGIDLTPWAGKNRVFRFWIHSGQHMGLDYLDFVPVGS
jgi:hypothetical protein